MKNAPTNKKESILPKRPIYVFVSHSHLDINPVRNIRNYLESIGLEPLLFFLKSLNDDSKITRLIRGEIDARIWFVYCKSNNAIKSNWVRSEVEYAKKTGKEFSVTIDLDKDLTKDKLNIQGLEKIDETANIIKQLQRIFIAYSKQDHPYIDAIMKCLNKYDIELVNPRAISPNWAESIANAIDDSSFVLLFYSDQTRDLPSLQAEYERAIGNKKVVYPIYLKDPRSKSASHAMRLPTFLDREQTLYYPFDLSDVQISANSLIMFLRSEIQKSYKNKK